MTALVCLLLLFAATAHAESFVLLTPPSETRLSGQQQHAARVLRNELRSQGLTVIDQERRLSETGDEALSCAEADCAQRLVRAAGVDLAAVVSIAESDASVAADEAKAAAVLVTLVDGRGARFPGRADVHDADLPAAARAALLDARALQLLGPGPWLSVLGEPEGAQVLLDGTLVGTVPYRFPVEPGRHALEVTLDGHRPFLQNIDVPASSTKPLQVRVALEPRGDAGETVVAALEQPDVAADDDSGSRPIVGPLILGAVGVAVLTQDVVMIATHGCERMEDGVCTRGTELHTGQAIALAAGGVAAIGGALLWHFLGGGDSPSRELSISPVGVELRGRF